MGQINYPRGTTYQIGHEYKVNGVDAVTGTKLLFTVKQSVDDDITDAQAIVKKTITMSGAFNTITINPGDIADTADDGDYVYDIKVIDSVLGTQLADSGTFTVGVTATNRLS